MAPTPPLHGAVDLGGRMKVPDMPEVKVHPENQNAFDAYRDIQDQNMVIEQHLSQMRMALDPLSAIQLRLTAMMEVLCPSDSVEGEARQIAVETEFQKLMHNVLNEMRRQAVTAQLQAGRQVDPAMLEAMHRAQGGKPVNNNLPAGFKR